MTTITSSPTAKSNSPSPSTPPPQPLPTETDWVAEALKLAPRFAERAVEHDETDSFVARNYAELKAARFFSAGVPVSLGGGGASYAELCEVIRKLAHACGSTALALSMHFHLIAALVWKWRHANAPVEDFLKRVAREELVLVSSGGSDWLESSGHAVEVEGGYRINARKIFSSGCPAGDLLMTSAVFDDPQAGPTVLHFPILLKDSHVKILPTWRTLGMRGTGSHDILIKDAFVPASAVAARRPRGRWHPALHVVAKAALPLVYSAYLGLAEKAREIALREVQSKRAKPHTQLLAGELENELFAARLAHERMMEIGTHWPPGPEATNAVLMARTLTGQAAVRTVEKAFELVGGRAFYRSLELERIFRDVQAARFHPVAEKPQQQFAGRLALGLEVDAS